MNADVICPVNIGRVGQRRRIVVGVVALAATLAATPWVLTGAVPRPAAALLALPFWFGMLGVLQGLQKT